MEDREEGRGWMRRSELETVELQGSSRQLALARPLSSAKLGPPHHTKASPAAFSLSALGHTSWHSALNTYDLASRCYNAQVYIRPSAASPPGVVGASGAFRFVRLLLAGKGFG
jgi:hypothetical protein